jgi:hypothetical protein
LGKGYEREKGRKGKKEGKENERKEQNKGRKKSYPIHNSNNTPHNNLEIKIGF